MSHHIHTPEVAMQHSTWQDLLVPPVDKNLIYEVFHENSKIGRHWPSLSPDEVRRRTKSLYQSLPFEGHPIIEFPPTLSPLNLSLPDAIMGRISARDLSPSPIDLKQVGTLFRLSYGITRSNEGTNYPRPFRVVPSGGALYPLEIFFHSTCVQGEPPGLYHYNPSKDYLRRVQDGDMTDSISERMVNPQIGRNASLLIFITAMFERTVFKYGDRGYRFTFLEAGHVAQNINLVATALGFGSVNIGGFFDREVDEFLDLDGITHSTIYMIAIGGNADPSGAKSA